MDFYVAAVRRAELREPTAAEAAAYTDWNASVDEFGPDAGPPPFLVTRDGTTAAAEHGVAGERTLCGLPRRELKVFAHLFNPHQPWACPDCAVRLPAPER